MQLYQILKLVQDNSFGVVVLAVIITSLVQVAPIEVNPWSAVISFISSIFNKEISAKIDKLETKIDGLEERVDTLGSKVTKLKDTTDEDRAVTARVRILRFADEIYTGKAHSKESFDTTLLDVDYYERYCVEHPRFKNNQTVMSVKQIKRAYEERLEKHDFLY